MFQFARVSARVFALLTILCAVGVTRPAAAQHRAPTAHPLILAEGAGELEAIAVDIARRSVLAHYPTAGRHPIRTLEIRTRPEGDVVHTFARLQFAVSYFSGKKFHESEVYATLIYTSEIRRVIDLGYKDNCLTAHRLFNRRVDLISKINEDYERRDPLQMPAPLVCRRLDLLPPRNAPWYWSLIGGDHAWHANAADSHIRHRWVPNELTPTFP